MKNLFKLLMAGVLLASVSCVQDITEDFTVGVPGATTEFTVGIEAPRVVLGDKDALGKYPLYWSNGDKISINGIASAALSIAEGVQTSQANFVVTPGEGQVLAAPFSVLYPSNTAGQVVFKTTQTYTEGTFANGTTPMYGYSEESATLTLKNLAGALKIGIKGEEGVLIKRITVESTDGQPLSGTFDIDCATGVLTATENVLSTVFVNTADGVALSPEVATYFYVALPAGEYTPIKITISAEDGQTMYVNAKDAAGAESFTLEAGQVKAFNELTFAENAVAFEIFDVEGLFEFADMVKAGTFANTYDKAVLISDIYAASGSRVWETLEGFNGIFDGKGFKILDLPAPLFGETAATISNVVLAAPHVSVSDRTDAGSIACRLVGYGSINNCTVEQFEGEGAIAFQSTDNAEAAVDHNFGGLVGFVAATASVNGCVVSGSIKYEGGTNTVVNLGGVVGTTEMGATISECTNNATITLTKECSGYFGGITGQSQAYILNSTNAGAITFDEKATTSQQLFVGGISGLNYNAYISFCVNDAPITLSGTVLDSVLNKEFYVGGLLGQVKRDVGSASVSPRDCQNTVNGDITIGGTITLRECTPTAGETSAKGTTNNHQCWGGLLGRSNQNGPARCINRGDLLVNATFTNTSSSYMTNSNKSNDSHFYISPWIGGIWGHGTTGVDAETINYGNITWTSACQFNVLLAGIFGRGSSAITNVVKNYGNVKFDAETTGNVYMGGFCPLAMQHHKYIENYGTIEFGENAKCAALYIAGVSGSNNPIRYEGTSAKSTHYAATGLKNYGKIIVNGDVTSTACVAGVCGYVGNAVFSDCQNLVLPEVEGSGSVVIGEKSSVTGKFYIAGVLAFSNSTASSCKVTSGQNDGTISFNGTAAANTYLGGIVGLTLRPQGVSSSTNNGAINFGGVNGNTSYVGGIIGYSQNGGTITDVHNRGDITVTATNKTVNASGIGAISATNEITNSSSICNVKSVSTDLNLGMFNGYAATSARKVTNSQVGGTIQRLGDEAPVAITADNYSKYLFSGNASYPAIEGTNYSNITVVDPNATPETPAEPEAPAEGEQPTE